MRILGTGSALPEMTVTNDDLSQFLDTSDEWISNRTGIRTRRVLSKENLFDLALGACKRALENASMTPEALDFIICSTVQGEWITPGMACALQEQLGAVCPCVDINGACAGFIYALDIADSYIATGRAKNILVVCAEAMSRLINWTDRSNCVLFGDGAGAAVVGAGEGIMKIRLTTHGNVDVLHYRASRGTSPYAKDAGSCDDGLKMKGPEVYKFAVKHSFEDLTTLLEACGLQPDQVAYYLLHQANLRILEAVRSRLKVGPEHMPHNIERTGNSSSASCAILLDELNRSGKFKNGDIIAMSAFGAGFVTAGALLKWNRG